MESTKKLRNKKLNSEMMSSVRMLNSTAQGENSNLDIVEMFTILRNKLKESQNGIKSMLERHELRFAGFKEVIDTQQAKICEITDKLEKNEREIESVICQIQGENSLNDQEKSVGQVIQVVREERNYTDDDPSELPETEKLNSPRFNSNENVMMYNNFLSSKEIFPGEDAENPLQFLNRLEEYFECRKVPMQFRMLMLERSLVGVEAKLWFRALKDSITDYERFKLEFRREFWGTDIQREFRFKIYKGSFWWQEEKTMSTYFLDLASKAQMLEPPIDCCELIDAIKTHYPAEVQRVLLTSRINSIQEMLALLRKIEVIDADRHGYPERISSYSRNSNYYSGRRNEKFERDKRSDDKWDDKTFNRRNAVPEKLYQKPNMGNREPKRDYYDYNAYGYYNQNKHNKIEILEDAGNQDISQDGNRTAEQAEAIRTVRESHGGLINSFLDDNTKKLK